jgi:hypothetical protein
VASDGHHAPSPYDFFEAKTEKFRRNARPEDYRTGGVYAC